MDHNIIEKFTTHLKSVLVRAYTLAHELGNQSITPDHLLWSLLTERGCLGAEILEKAKVSHERVREAIARRVEENGDEDSEQELPPLESSDKSLPTLADSTKRAIEKAVLTANMYEHKYVGTEHLLSGLLQVDDDILVGLLSSERVNIGDLKEHIASVLRSTSKFPGLGQFGKESESEDGREGEVEEGTAAPAEERKRGRRAAPKSPALDFFTIDLTGAEAQKRIDPVIGREKEIERVVQILCRRTKNNPVLLGDPGVGKTAIVEGLARRIAEGSVPEVLKGKRLLALDLALVVAGTVYRGEFEGRVKQILDEVRSRPDVILFIDEVHNITGTGSASGSMDAANILKPALARGDIRCIGATTLPEYKKYIEADAALDRRFQPILVDEPTAEETRAIVLGIRSRYESFHGITITDEAIDAAVRYGARYLQDRMFPDKAIDLIDEASAALRVRSPVRPGENALKDLVAELAKLRSKKQHAVRAERFVQALELKEQELALAQKIESAERNEVEERKPLGSIGSREVADVVSRMTGIPLASILAEEGRELTDLEERLASRVIGQEEAIRAVTDHIRRARAGLVRGNRPLASFLFLGPSGVGKTSLASAIAEEVFHDSKALVRLDMSEFGESFTVSKILGAPAGYVGYREGTRFIDVVKRRPYSVVLFDEVEKAHPDVLNVLLQILEDGHLTDATGRTVHFTHTIVVLTSNVGSDRLRTGPLGFGGANSLRETLSDLRRDAEQFFRPELVNRLDRLLVFKPLSDEEIEKIYQKELAELNTSLKERGLKVTLSRAALKKLVASSRSEVGARAVRRLLEEHVISPLANRLLEEKKPSRGVFTVDSKEEAFVYRFRRA